MQAIHLQEQSYISKGRTKFYTLLLVDSCNASFDQNLCKFAYILRTYPCTVISFLKSLLAHHIFNNKSLFKKSQISMSYPIEQHGCVGTENEKFILFFNISFKSKITIF